MHVFGTNLYLHNRVMGTGLDPYRLLSDTDFYPYIHVFGTYLYPDMLVCDLDLYSSICITHTTLVGEHKGSRSIPQ